jgi:hypothetical protein
MGFRMLVGAEVTHIHGAPIAPNHFLRNMSLRSCSFVAEIPRYWRVIMSPRLVAEVVNRGAFLQGVSLTSVSL